MTLEKCREPQRYVDGEPFSWLVWIRKKQTGLINNDVDNGYGLRCIRNAARYEIVLDGSL